MTEIVPGDMNVSRAVPLFGVHDIQRSLRFYVDGLGFTKTYEWMPEGQLRWCWLNLGTAAVMLQEFWKEGSHQNVPTTELGVGVSMNFMCDDALAIYHHITARGLEAQQPFVGNEMWVVGITDPDGYRLFFQSPTDVPEETVYRP
jgi:Glyoxalase/Bleomycin resistance protein/Dioxygenase superfamily.